MFGPDIEAYKKLLDRRRRWRSLTDEEKAIEMRELHLPRFWGIVPYLVDEARRMTIACAMSHRGFCVGSAIYAFKSDPYYINDFYQIFRGSNLKPINPGPNICAEMSAVQAARHAGYELIIGIVIAGEPQEDHQSGITTKTLQPCGNCRTFLSAIPEMRRDTDILTVQLDGDEYEINTFAEILAKHNHCEK